MRHRPPHTLDLYVIGGPRRQIKAEARAVTTVVPKLRAAFDPDWGVSSTSEYLVEEERDDAPYAIGVLDEHGEHIYRIPYRDTVPFGFHHIPNEFGEYEDEEDEGF